VVGDARNTSNRVDTQPMVLIIRASRWDTQSR